MQEDELVEVIRENGYIPVRDCFAYHAFRAVDLEVDRVKGGSCPVTSFVAAFLPRLSAEQAANLIRRGELTSGRRAGQRDRRSYDVTRVYQVYPFRQELPVPILRSPAALRRYLELEGE
jgi:hypothetical protein